MRFIGFLLLAISAVRADVVVSIRYFKSEGTSHWHLYHFRDDGTLIRQLTSPEDAHDLDPQFSKDGRSIFFTRKKAKKRETMCISAGGTHLRHATPPASYPPEEPPSYGPDDSGENDRLTRKRWEPHGDGFRMKIPGSRDELLMTKEDMYGPDGIGADTGSPPFVSLTVREADTGKETRLKTLDGPPWSCDFMTIKGDPFLRRDGLNVAFFYQITGSSAVYRAGAVDLIGNRVIRITDENPAVIYPHATRPGFFSVSAEYYQPLPGTEMTVNCTYLDWWDKEFKRTRFANRIGLFGGASIRVKGQPQLDIPGTR